MKLWHKIVWLVLSALLVVGIITASPLPFTLWFCGIHILLAALFFAGKRIKIELLDERDPRGRVRRLIDG
ncbi:MAG: hypothetical protein SF162_01190 [bacterium]|nr:hypothetical protein [bacterium]